MVKSGPNRLDLIRISFIFEFNKDFTLRYAPPFMFVKKGISEDFESISNFAHLLVRGLVGGLKII